jgi:hypothetical protein
MHYRGSTADLNAALAALPSVIAGVGADPAGVGESLCKRMGVALLSQIQQAFVVKARGGVGSDGIAWKPLKRATIAARRTTAKEKKSLGVGGKRVRGLLTPAQDKLWRRVFAGQKARMDLRGIPGSAAIAAKMAWAAVKAAGGRTKLDVLGGRKVEILRDSGRLLRSFAPGVEDRPSGAAEQVFAVAPGRVTVGTNVPYAARQHADRPFWPDAMPEPWARAVFDALSSGLMKVLGQYLGRR